MPPALPYSPHDYSAAPRRHHELVRPPPASPCCLSCIGQPHLSVASAPYPRRVRELPPPANTISANETAPTNSLLAEPPSVMARHSDGSGRVLPPPSLIPLLRDFLDPAFGVSTLHRQMSFPGVRLTTRAIRLPELLRASLEHEPTGGGTLIDDSSSMLLYPDALVLSWPSSRTAFAARTSHGRFNSPTRLGLRHLAAAPLPCTGDEPP